MLIITEKPNVTKEFAKVLGCSFSDGYYSNGNTDITNCRGHLYKLFDAQDYDEKYKSWKELPILPKNFSYKINEDVKIQALLVKKLLNKHKNDKIIIATDAGREGEIIARECLLVSGITNFSNIKRFWSSQALTKEVILEGIKNAKPLDEYNHIGEEGFARQHSDWLCGINFTRYISVNSYQRTLTVGRVQTAILSAIKERCDQIENFKSKKYYEFWADFICEAKNASCKGIYFENEKTSFFDEEKYNTLKNDIGKVAKLLDKKTEKKETLAPQLYNLAGVQKDAFRLFGYSPEKTLEIIQSLYEKHKCVSYPRTPSKVMGTQNVELCQNIFTKLFQNHPDFDKIKSISDISLKNKRVFDDSKLEDHHALIPLKNLPQTTTEEEKNIYSLILKRFFIAFASPYIYEKQNVIVEVNGNKYKISGKKVLDNGWKDFENFETKNVATLRQNNETENEEQNLENIDFNSLKIKDINCLEKFTRPPKYFNEASILAFMENPKSEDENKVKLIGLGTPATYHTFIPILMKREYINIDSKKNILVTELGRAVLKAIQQSEFKNIANIDETTNWERKLKENPKEFEKEITEYVIKSVSKKIDIHLPDLQKKSTEKILCPKCQNPIREGNKNYYCSNYKNGCNFVIWKTISGASITENDVIALCSQNHQTKIKEFTSKQGKKFKVPLYLTENFEVKFKFENK